MKESIPYLVSIGMLVLQYGFYKHSIIATYSQDWQGDVNMTFIETMFMFGVLFLIGMVAICVSNHYCSNNIWPLINFAGASLLGYCGYIIGRVSSDKFGTKP